jgi:hypothetical protein
VLRGQGGPERGWAKDGPRMEQGLTEDGARVRSAAISKEGTCVSGGARGSS